MIQLSLREQRESNQSYHLSRHSNMFDITCGAGARPRARKKQKQRKSDIHRCMSPIDEMLRRRLRAIEWKRALREHSHEEMRNYVL